MLRLSLLACLVLCSGCDVAGLLAEPSGTTPTASGEPWGEMVSAVNAARATGRSCGGAWKEAAPPVTWNGSLQKAASRHSRDMARTGRFSHEGSDGSRVGQRATRAGYAWRSVGENLALMDLPVQSVVSALLRSASHCSAIMDPAFAEMGAAREGDYWTQVFGRPR